uniref:Ig-like domain-containing protein n=1 Tax=Pundamilia nyererei TaxID=303518 RepID=A0A3B4HAK0_9CICH
GQWDYHKSLNGDKVTLPCENVMKNHHNCNAINWLFIESRSTPAVELVNHGQIKEKAKSDRLSVTAECSLVIKKVTAKDLGRYTCRQFRDNPGKKQGPDAVVYLSDVIMTEQKNTDQVTLNCSVWTYKRCKHKVRWIHDSGGLNRDYSNIKTLQSPCSAAVTFIKSSYSHISNSDFKCNVTTEENKEQLFTFRPQSSGKKPGEIRLRKLLSTDVRKELLITLLIFAVKLIVLKRGERKSHIKY